MKRYHILFGTWFIGYIGIGLLGTAMATVAGTPLFAVAWVIGWLLLPYAKSPWGPPEHPKSLVEILPAPYKVEVVYPQSALSALICTPALRRELRMHINGGSHTPAEWRALLIRFNHRCAACGRKRNVAKDHIIPVAHGGSSNIDNIQPLCRSCNSKKGTDHTDYRRGR